MILCTLCCLWQGGKGKLAVLGSCHMFSDQYIDKEENGKILVSFNTHVPVCLYMSVCVSIAICVNKCVDSCVNSVSCWWWLVNKHVNSCCVIPLSPSGCESLRWGSATRVLLLHSSQSFASTGVRFKVVTSCEMVFIHCFLSVCSIAFPDSNFRALLLRCSGHHLSTGH